MARIFSDSFDHYATADILNKWSTLQGFIGIGPGGRYGNCLQMNFPYSATSLRRNLPASYTENIVGFAFNLNVLPLTSPMVICEFGSDSNVQTAIFIDNAGRIGVTFNSVTLCESSPSMIQAGIYYHVQLDVAHSTTTSGSCTLRLNSDTVATVSGVATSSTGSINQICIVNNLGQPYVLLVDDFWINDTTGSVNNGFDGDINVIYLPAAGPGQTTEWTSNGSNPNWQNVSDAAPDGDTTYNYAASAGLIDLYALATPPTGIVSVLNVQTVLDLRKDDSGPASVAPAIGNGSTSTVGTANSEGNNYGFLLQNWGTNPNDSAAWTASDLSTLQVGPKRTV